MLAFAVVVIGGLGSLPRRGAGRADRRPGAFGGRALRAGSRAVQHLCRDGAGADRPSERPVRAPEARKIMKAAIARRGRWRWRLVGLLLVGGLVAAAMGDVLVILALGKGMVVLGLMLLMRTGLVSFGQGLYYCLGAYAAVRSARIFELPDSC